MTGITIDVEWSYHPGSEVQPSTDYDGLIDASVNANVCVDMFLAPDKSDSSNTSLSTFEVMVWLGQFGNSTIPLGLEDGSLEAYIIDGTTL